MLFSLLTYALIGGLIGVAVVGCLAWIARELKGTAEGIRRANPHTPISRVAGEIRNKFRSGNFRYATVGLYAIDDVNDEVYDAGEETVACEREFADDVKVGKIFAIA